MNAAGSPASQPRASRLFEELDHQVTSLGELSLRRRRLVSLDAEAYEVKLGDEYLMSSLFAVSEEVLGRLGVAECGGDGLDVVVGGLGLGHTADAVLQSDAVASMLVVEMLEPVIAWHRRSLVPLGARITTDRRCRILVGDFFALAACPNGFDPECPGRRFHAILLDIDHSPDALLDPRSEGFYQPDGLHRLRRHLAPAGVFGLWSNEPPDGRFTARLASVFSSARAEPVTFHNPLQNREFTQTVYLARR